MASRLQKCGKKIKNFVLYDRNTEYRSSTLLVFACYFDIFHIYINATFLKYFNFDEVIVHYNIAYIPSAGSFVENIMVSRRDVYCAIRMG